MKKMRISLETILIMLAIALLTGFFAGGLIAASSNKAELGSPQAYFDARGNINPLAISDTNIKAMKEYLSEELLPHLDDEYQVLDYFTRMSNMRRLRFDFWVLCKDTYGNYVSFVFSAETRDDAEMLVEMLRGDIRPDQYYELTVIEAPEDTNKCHFLVHVVH